MTRQKRAAAIHDVSGVGKCSLTAALPIISAAGIEVAAAPTAVLSTHTGDITGFTYRDLTEDLPAFFAHWRSLGLRFDCVYSGFLGSAAQVDVVRGFLEDLRDGDPLVVVDPAMADGGKMYKTFGADFVDKIKSLCEKADILLPNPTEAAFLTGEKYSEPPHDKGRIEKLLKRLSDAGPTRIVLTGVSFGENEIGCAVYRRGDGIFYRFSKKFPGIYYGTGDVFASAFVGAYLRGKDVFESASIALDFTSRAVERTYIAKTDPRFGVDFENGLGEYIKRLEEG